MLLLKKEDGNYFRNLLAERDVYYVSGSIVGPNRRNYWVVLSPYMIRLIPGTVIHKVVGTAPNIELDKFNVASFEEARKRCRDDSILMGKRKMSSNCFFFYHYRFYLVSKYVHIIPFFIDIIFLGTFAVCTNRFNI